MKLVLTYPGNKDEGMSVTHWEIDCPFGEDVAAKDADNFAVTMLNTYVDYTGLSPITAKYKD